MGKQKLKIIFSKTGDMRLISHLDLVRLFQRASRRAALPVTVTQGFNPRLKISITHALKLGVESLNEEVLFYMETAVRPDNFVSCMNLALPGGVRIISAEEKI